MIQDEESDSVPEFIAELIRAANENERVSIQERRAVLRRAAITIRQFEGEYGELGDSSPVKDIIEASLLPRVVVDEQAQGSLLYAVGMIRLH